MKIKIICLTILFFSSISSKAQMSLDWSTFINADIQNGITSAMDSSDNYYIAFKRFYDSREHFILQKFDSNGVYLWQAVIEPDSTLFPYGYILMCSLRVDKDQNLTAMLYCQAGITIKRIDSNGALIYEKVFPQSSGSNTFQSANGSNYFWGWDGNASKAFINISDAAGSTIQTDSLSTFGAYGYDCMYGDSLDNVYLYASSASNLVHYHYYNDQLIDSIILPSALFYHDQFKNRYLYSQGTLTKYDSTWAQEWIINVSYFDELKADSSENFYVYENLNGPTQPQIKKFNSSGQELWSAAINTSNIRHKFTDLHITTHGDLVVSGAKYDMPVVSNSDNNTIFVAILNSEGHLIRYFEKKFSGADNATVFLQHLKSDDQYYFVELNIEAFAYTFYLDRLDLYGNPNFEGLVYYDGNSNCIQDTIESNLDEIKFILTPGNYYTQSNSFGKFYFKIPDGNYLLNHSTPNNWVNTCPTSTVPITISNGAMTNGTTLFGKAAIPGLNDLMINFSNSTIRPGAYVTFVVHYQNLGSTLVSGSVRFEFDTIFTFVNSTPFPDTVNLHSLIWNFSGLNPGESGYIVFRLYITQFETPGTEYTNTAYINAINGDDHPENDMQSDSGVVVGSLDPNEKYVTPKGIGPAGSINYSDSLLCYKIAFQNVGTDTAFFVQVIDTLDPSLDPLTYFPGVIYPPGTCTLSGDGVLRFVFDPVLIPDSTTDEANSHGFINYFIKVKPNLPLGTVIKNKADIYFDYNPPVTTNTTVNTIDSTVSVTEININKQQFTVYPNPSNNKLFVRNENPDQLFEAALFSIQGKQVTGTLKGKQSIQFDIKNLFQGIYILRILNGNVTTFKNVVVIKN